MVKIQNQYCGLAALGWGSHRHDSEPQREKEQQRAGSTFKKGIAGRLRGSRVRAGRLSPGIEAGVEHSMPRAGFPGQKGAVCQDSSLREVTCEEADN